MGRTGRAVAAVALMFLIAIILSKRLPAPAANGQARRCEIPAEPPRPLHLDRFADRAHLRAEAATAESWAIAYADVSPLRQQGAGPYADVRDQCMPRVAAGARVSRRLQYHFDNTGFAIDPAAMSDLPCRGTHARRDRPR